MTEHEDLVQRLVGCYNRRDADGLESILHLDARYSAPGSVLGADILGRYQIIEYFKRLVFAAFERVDIQVLHRWEDRDLSVVIVEWRSDMWPTGLTKYENSGVFVVEVADGLVSCIREYNDTEAARAELSRSDNQD
jgi:ketosteroid isomerase-like protein